MLSFHVLQPDHFDEDVLVENLTRQSILVRKLTRQNMFVKLETVKMEFRQNGISSNLIKSIPHGP